jgi:peroxiredoxin
LLVFLVVILVQAWQGRNLADGPAPPLTGISSTGQPVDLAGYRGQPVLVYFWAEWCPVCRFAEDGISRLAADHPVVGVAVASGDAEAVAAYHREHGLRFTSLLDEEGRQLAEWGASGVPTAFIVDGQGHIRFASSGYSSEWGLRLRLWVARWL